MPDEFICITQAVKRGYATRATISAWANEGFIRSFRRGRERMVSVRDLDARAALREQNLTPGFDTDRETERMAARIAATAPALRPDQKKRLATLLMA